MLGDYIKKLTDKGYKLSFENPIEEADWMCIKISKNDYSVKVTISPCDLEWMGGDTRKVFANEYIDDRNFTFLSQTDRMELLGRMVDVVEDWLEKKGMATDDKATIIGEDYNYLTEGFAAGMGISCDCTEEKRRTDIHD